MVRHALLAVLAIAAVAQAETPPAFSVMPGGTVAIALPQSLLQDATVRKQLASGLTTVVTIVAKDSATNLSGGARFEIRYDLWDEVWLVRKTEFDGHAEAQRIPSFDGLLQWWHAPTRLLATNTPRVFLSVELRVLPFSAAEEQDAREWISKSGGVASPAGAGTFVQTLIATTITARPIITHRWTTELQVR